MKSTKEKNIPILQNIALISAAFAILLCVLIILNFIQLKRTDPLNSDALSTLIERLKVDPADEQLRTEIRTLDLVARKVYFTSQWQLRTGGLLLFGSIVVILLCFHIIDLLRKKIPAKPATAREDIFFNKGRSRNYIMISGSLIVGLALLSVLISGDMGSDLNITSTDHNKSLIADTIGKSDQALSSDTTGTSKGLSLLTDSVSANIDTSLSAGGYPTNTELRENFPAFRGFGGNGISFQKNIPTKWDGKSGNNILWKIKVPLPGYNSPVYWKDKIYLSGANEKKKEIYCIDAKSGKIEWTFLVGEVPGSTAQVPKVNKETGFSAPTVTTDGRMVYAIFANGDLVALNMTGKLVWAKSMGFPKNHYGHSSSLITWHDILLVQYDQSGNAFVAGLSGKTGDQLWKTTRNVKISWASPILVNTGKRTELIIGADPYLASYDPSNGNELWKIDCLGGEVGPSPCYANGIVFSVNEYSKLVAVQMGETPKQLWESSEYLSDVPSPVATDKYLFMNTSYGTMVCYDVVTGEQLWVQDAATNMYSSPILAEGKIFQLDQKGIMHIYKAEGSFQYIAKPQLGEGSFCTPAFADGRIFIRGDHHLFCIGQ